MSPEEIVSGLRRRSERLGFSLVGVTRPDPSAHTGFYEDWVEAGHHGEMAYLARPDARERRADLRLTMAGVRSVVAVAHEYGPPGSDPGDPSRAIVAAYARGRDYHDVLKEKLLELLEWIDGAAGDRRVQGRAYVDTGPVLERDLARRAGLGWFGKNTMLIHPRRGSYFFLGLLLIDLELPADEPFDEDRCGSCRACLDACPTGALLGRDESGAPVIDARRCISYLTIELRGPIPRELRPGLGNRIFGCDICQEVCPWNERFAEQSQEEAYRARAGMEGPSLIDLARELLALDEQGFRKRFRGSPVTRPKRRGLLRNVCVALGNWGSDHAVPVLTAALSDAEPLVRGHAAWALGRVGSERARDAAERRLGAEEDAWVRSEITAAVSSG